MRHNTNILPAPKLSQFFFECYKSIRKLLSIGLYNFIIKFAWGMGNSGSKDDSKERTGYIFHDVKRWQLKPGDHIYCYRKLGLYTHHGIYTGNRKHEVIHFSNPYGSKLSSKNGARICSCSLEDFLDGKQLRLVSYNVGVVTAYVKRWGTTHAWVARDPEDVVNTAVYYLENPSEWENYNLLFNNCETFAVYCKTGIALSSQTWLIKP